jgi:hypothetical protein
MGFRINSGGFRVSSGVMNIKPPMQLETPCLEIFIYNMFKTIKNEKDTTI